MARTQRRATDTETTDSAVSDEPSTPGEWAKHWQKEVSSARKEVEKWHKRADKITKRFKDERDAKNANETRWNLFSTNVITLRSMLFGRTPQVTVGRRYGDAKDDLARVAGEMLERLLNCDIQRDADTYSQALQYALDDRLLVGMGNIRIRYVHESEEVAGKDAVKDEETGKELAPPVEAYQQKTNEDVEVDYVHWKDQLWSPCRVFHEARWWAFRAQMSRRELIKRFGKEIGSVVPLNSKKDDGSKKGASDPLERADVWEIWSKDERKVYWWVDGHPQTLDIQDDPLELDGFWPFPKPMMANATTDSFMAVPDFVLAQDLYDEIDTVSTRITVLERAIRVAGVYNKAAPGISRLLKDAGENELVPVDGWAMFAEKGGIAGQVEWLPLEPIVTALSALRETRSELIDALYQITGLSDIMRGQASNEATATEQGIKARFGSVRVQAQQDEFARFASDVQRLKCEVISKLFDPSTIAKRSNAEFSFDSQMIQPAIQLIKDRLESYRIEVKPENVSLTDFAQMKAERMDMLQGIATFMQQAAPVAQAIPGSMPFMLQILQWAVAGFRGASQIEGVLDQAIEQAKQAQQQAAANPQPPPPDPKLQAEQVKLQGVQMKVQGDLQREQLKGQNRQQELQAEAVADDQREQSQMHWNTQEALKKAIIQKEFRPPQLPGAPKPFGGGFPR